MEKSYSKEYTTWGDITGFDSAEVIDYERQDNNSRQIQREGFQSEGSIDNDK